MKRVGQHKHDGSDFADEASFKNDSNMSGRRARKNCRIIARSEKRSENKKILQDAKNENN